jgi:hypothetical protein
VKLEEVEDELKTLQAKARDLRTKVGLGGCVHHRAFNQHREILSMSIVELEELERQQLGLKRKYDEVCSWFRMEEASGKKSFGDFFGIVDGFIRDIALAHAAAQELARKARRREKSRSLSCPRRGSMDPMCDKVVTRSGSGSRLTGSRSGTGLNRSSSFGSTSRRAGGASVVSDFPSRPRAIPSAEMVRRFSAPNALMDFFKIAMPPGPMPDELESSRLDRVEKYAARLDVAFSASSEHGKSQAVVEATADYISRLVTTCVNVAAAREAPSSACASAPSTPR